MLVAAANKCMTKARQQTQATNGHTQHTIRVIRVPMTFPALTTKLRTDLNPEDTPPSSSGLLVVLCLSRSTYDERPVPFIMDTTQGNLPVSLIQDTRPSSCIYRERYKSSSLYIYTSGPPMEPQVGSQWRQRGTGERVLHSTFEHAIPMYHTLIESR